MKILMITAAIEAPNVSGIGSGGSTHAQEVVKGFTKLGHTVVLVCAKAKKQKTFDVIYGSRIVRIFSWGGISKNKVNIDILNNKKITKKALERVMFLYKLSRELWYFFILIILGVWHKPDVIYERTCKSSLAASLLSILLQRPLICEVNDHHFFNLSLSWASLIIVPDKTGIRSNYHHKCLEIPWGVDAEYFSPLETNYKDKTDLAYRKHVRLVFTSSFLKWHGASDLVKAVAMLYEYNIEVFMIGDGPCRAEAELLANELGLHNKISFLGYVEYEKIPYLLNLCDIAVAPYTSELTGLRAKIATPIKVLEYMSAGLPTIVSDAGNKQNLIENQFSGLIFQTDNQDSLIDKIRELIMDPQKCKNLGENARNIILEKYTWAKHCEAIEKALKDKHKYNTREI